jgi:hypothetical protein
MISEKNYPFGINPMPPIGSFMRAYRQLCQGDARDEPIDETVTEFANRLGWPVDDTVRVAQRCHETGLIETSIGMGEVVTAATLIEGKYL